MTRLCYNAKINKEIILLRTKRDGGEQLWAVMDANVQHVWNKQLCTCHVTMSKCLYPCTTMTLLHGLLTDIFSLSSLRALHSLVNWIRGRRSHVVAGSTLIWEMMHLRGLPPDKPPIYSVWACWCRKALGETCVGLSTPRADNQIWVMQKMSGRTSWLYPHVALQVRNTAACQTPSSGASQWCPHRLFDVAPEYVELYKTFVVHSLKKVI